MRLIHVRRIADKQEVRKQVDRDEYGQDPEPVVPDDRPQLAEVDPFDCIAGLKRSCLHDRQLFLLLITMISVTMLADRKSTRLNSSHVKISYAVFCLKK